VERPRPLSRRRRRALISQAAPLRNGSYSLVDFEDEFLFNYARPEMTVAEYQQHPVYFKQTVVGPARVAGSILDRARNARSTVKELRSAMDLPTPSQRRGAPRCTRRLLRQHPAPTPTTMRTSDQFDMLNGAAPIASPGNSSAKKR